MPSQQDVAWAVGTKVYSPAHQDGQHTIHAAPKHNKERMGRAPTAY
jgi:hypothetical protein